MATPFKTNADGLDIHIHKFNVQQYQITDPELFSAKSPKVGIWHSIAFHYYNGNIKSAVGELFIIFLNNQDGSKLALELDLKLSARGEFPSDAEMFLHIVKYAFSFISDYVNETETKDEKGEPFTVPAFQLTKEYFQYAFPD
jgi:hypothetical protein